MSFLAYLNPLSYFGSSLSEAKDVAMEVQTIEQPSNVVQGDQAPSCEHFRGLIEYQVDEANGEDDSFAKFVLRSANFETEFIYFYLETEFLKDEWAKIYSEDPSAYLGFCTSNGEVSISVDSTHTIFHVGKHGSGGDGHASMKVPNIIALPVLRQTHTEWVEHFKNNKKD